MLDVEAAAEPTTVVWGMEGVRGVGGRGRRGVVFFTDGGPSVAGINPAVAAVFARALTTFSQFSWSRPTSLQRSLDPVVGFRGVREWTREPLPHVK